MININSTVQENLTETKLDIILSSVEENLLNEFIVFKKIKNEKEREQIRREFLRM